MSNGSKISLASQYSLPLLPLQVILSLILAIVSCNIAEKIKVRKIQKQQQGINVHHHTGAVVGVAPPQTIVVATGVAVPTGAPVILGSPMPVADSKTL